MSVHGKTQKAIGFLNDYNICFKKTIGSLPNIIISFLAIILNMIAYNLIAIKIPIVIFNQEKLISTT
ncbi:MAG TPA: hypothetical protein DGP89_05250 [Saprospirales bacterium]|jgi:hypothetical protein|nr:hypothetical protein [Saprospirales bacterium]